MQNNMGVQRTQRTRPENTRGHIGIWTSIRDEKEGGCPPFPMLIAKIMIK
jgi:hypothetical protein